MVKSVVVISVVVKSVVVKSVVVISVVVQSLISVAGALVDKVLTDLSVVIIYPLWNLSVVEYIRCGIYPLWLNPLWIYPVGEISLLLILWW